MLQTTIYIITALDISDRRNTPAFHKKNGSKVLKSNTLSAVLKIAANLLEVPGQHFATLMLHVNCIL